MCFFYILENPHNSWKFLNFGRSGSTARTRLSRQWRYCIHHIFRRGVYFREFRESGAIRDLNNTRKYLPPIPTHTTCVRNTSSTVHSARARQDRYFLPSENEWMISTDFCVHCSPPWSRIEPLAKMSWSPDSWKIRLAKYMAYTVNSLALR